MKFFRDVTRRMFELLSEMVAGAFFLAVVFSVIFVGSVLVKLFIDNVVDIYYHVQSLM